MIHLVLSSVMRTTLKVNLMKKIKLKMCDERMLASAGIQPDTRLCVFESTMLFLSLVLAPVTIIVGFYIL